MRGGGVQDHRVDTARRLRIKSIFMTCTKIATEPLPKEPPQGPDAFALMTFACLESERDRGRGREREKR